MRAADDTFSAEQDTPLLIPLADLTANDQLNPGSDAIVISRDPSVGQLVGSPDGFLNYVPPDRFVGTVNFVYWLENGPERSNVATVTITVRSTDLANRPPVANLDRYFHTTYSSDTGGTLVVDAAHGVLANDTDADGDVLAAFLYQGQERLLSLRADGSFEFRAPPGYSSDNVFGFTYGVDDGRHVVHGLLSITLAGNNPPTAADDAYDVDVSTGVRSVTVSAVAGVLANDFDREGDAFTARLYSPPAHGVLELRDNGSFVYQPDAGFAGLDSFTYRAFDGNHSFWPATVHLRVTGGPAATAAAVADEYAVDEDGTLDIPSSQGVLANDTAPDGTLLGAERWTDPSHGTLTLEPSGAFVYTPDADFYGTDTFTYRLANASASPREATVTITVNPMNDAPVAFDDVYEVDEDSTLRRSAFSGVLRNDDDPNGDALTVSLLAGPAHGTLVLHANGSFEYTPAADYYGEDSFTYVVSDGALAEVTERNTGRVTITVQPVNDAPEASGGSYAVTEDEPSTHPLTVVEYDGDPVVLELVEGPEWGSSASTPARGPSTTARPETTSAPTPSPTALSTESFTAGRRPSP